MDCVKFREDSSGDINYEDVWDKLKYPSKQV